MLMFLLITLSFACMWFCLWFGCCFSADEQKMETDKKMQEMLVETGQMEDHLLELKEENALLALKVVQQRVPSNVLLLKQKETELEKRRSEREKCTASPKPDGDSYRVNSSRNSNPRSPSAGDDRDSLDKKDGEEENAQEESEEQRAARRESERQAADEEAERKLAELAKQYWREEGVKLYKQIEQEEVTQENEVEVKQRIVQRQQQAEVKHVATKEKSPPPSPMPTYPPIAGDVRPEFIEKFSDTAGRVLEDKRHFRPLSSPMSLDDEISKERYVQERLAAQSAPGYIPYELNSRGNTSGTETNKLRAAWSTYTSLDFPWAAVPPKFKEQPLVAQAPGNHTYHRLASSGLPRRTASSPKRRGGEEGGRDEKLPAYQDPTHPDYMQACRERLLKQAQALYRHKGSRISAEVHKADLEKADKKQRYYERMQLTQMAHMENPLHAHHQEHMQGHYKHMRTHDRPVSGEGRFGRGGVPIRQTAGSSGPFSSGGTGKGLEGDFGFAPPASGALPTFSQSARVGHPAMRVKAGGSSSSRPTTGNDLKNGSGEKAWKPLNETTLPTKKQYGQGKKFDPKAVYYNDGQTQIQSGQMNYALQKPIHTIEL